MRTAKAGWCETEITPPLGLPMGGRGPRFSPGKSILDPLEAGAIFLQDPDGNRTLWVSLDLIGFSYSFGAGLRYGLASICEVPIDSIVLNFAHIHSGPMVNFDLYAADLDKPEELESYQATLRERILLTARRACDSASPADLTLHSGESDLGINRRNRDGKGQIGMRPNPDGVYNPDLWVLDIESAGRRCVVFSYGCHPVIVYGYAWQGISADFPGATRRQLEDSLGDGVEAHFIQGLAGNVRPRVLADLKTGTFRKSRPPDLDDAARLLAGDVVKALEREGEELNLEIEAAEGSFLARRDPEAVKPLSHWQELASSEQEILRNLGRYWSRRMRDGPPLSRSVPCSIGLIRLDRAHEVAWLSGEPVAEWQGLIRGWLGDDQVVVWGYCQHVSDYIPTDELIAEGGYEVVASNRYAETGPGPFAPSLNSSMRDAIISLNSRL